MDDSDIQNMVKGNVPRLFAVVEEADGDAWVEAWGLVMDEQTEVVSVDGGYRMTLEGPESALQIFNAVEDTEARLVWV